MKDAKISWPISSECALIRLKKKMIETRSTHQTPADGNVFLDLGFSPAEAASLKANADRIISEELAIKNTKIHTVENWNATKNPRSS